MSSHDIIAICKKHIVKYNNDCSGFAKAVAHDCGILLFGQANDIVDQLANAPLSSEWNLIPDGVTASSYAKRGYFVIAGAKASGNGHVAVVVDGPLAHGKYPYAFWGRYKGLTVLGETVNVGFSQGHGTLNYSFGTTARDTLTYAAITPLELLMPRASMSEGWLIHR